VQGKFPIAKISGYLQNMHCPYSKTTTENDGELK